jgi:hypothetical protein
MWHSGHGHSDTAGHSSPVAQLTPAFVTAAMTLRWVSTAPFARPVVPDV